MKVNGTAVNLNLFLFLTVDSEKFPLELKISKIPVTQNPKSRCNQGFLKNL